MACLKGFEPPTNGLEGRCSILLSYRHRQTYIILERVTHRARLCFGAGDGEYSTSLRGGRLTSFGSAKRPVRFPQSYTLCKICNSTPLVLLMERGMGIGPTRPAWKAGILPLNYTRTNSLYIIPDKTFSVNNLIVLFATNLLNLNVQIVLFVQID